MIYRSAKKQYFVLAIFLVFLFSGELIGQTSFTIDVLRLSGSEFESSTGYYRGFPTYSRQGTTIGRCYRFDGEDYRGTGAWLFDGQSTQRLGIFGADHTNSAGEQNSYLWFVEGDDTIFGGSSVYSNGGTYLGSSIWIFDGANTIPLGFQDSNHVTPTGGYVSNIVARYGNDLIAGESTFFGENASDPATNYRELSAFLYDRATTTIENVGLLDHKHTTADGRRSSDVFGFGPNGELLGASRQARGGNSFYGTTAWIYHKGQHNELGLITGEHVGSAGITINIAEDINDMGHVAGSAAVYNGFNPAGWSAWFYDGDDTVQIGLTDSEHQDKDGFSSNRSIQINDIGQVVGYSSRLNDGQINGYSLWMYDASTNATNKIGPSDSEHTRSDGYQNPIFHQNINWDDMLTNTGAIYGWSERFNGSPDNQGYTVWKFDGVDNVKIGLFGGEFLGENGSSTNYRAFEFPSAETGRAAGHTYRYDGSSNHGIATWYHDGKTTQRIGLTSSEYIRSNGYMYSEITDATKSELIVGWSKRYNGSSVVGGVNWVFDPVTKQTTPMLFSENEATGYAYSSIQSIEEDGLVLGRYTKFDEDGNDLGLRAFCFTFDAGMIDLSDVVGEKVLSNKGIRYLSNAFGTDEAGNIYGTAITLDVSKSQVAFVMKPVDGAATDVAVQSIDVVRGDLQSGSLTEIATSDNVDVSIRRSNRDVQSSVEFEVTSNSPVAFPTSLGLSVESSVFARTNVVQTIEFFNYQTGEFDEVSSKPSSRFIDSVQLAESNVHASKYIEPVTNAIKARIRFLSPQTRQRFAASIDHVFWAIQ